MPISTAKPADAVPAWSYDDPGTTRLEPILGQKETGWTNGQVPPFSVMNWLQGVQSDWLDYFEAATDELDATKLDRDGSQTMDGDLLPGADGTLQLGDVGAEWAILYTVDAIISNTLIIEGQANVHDVVPDGDDDTYVLGTNALRFLEAFIGGVTLHEDPADNAALTNRMTAAQIPKAQGRILLNGSTPSLVAGTGVNVSAVVDDSGVKVTLAAAMDSTDYMVFTQHNKSPIGSFLVEAVVLSATEFALVASDGGSPVDLTGGSYDGIKVGFVIFGRQ